MCFVLVLSACGSRNHHMSEARNFPEAENLVFMREVDGVIEIEEGEFYEVAYELAVADSSARTRAMASTTITADRVIHRASIGIVAEDFDSEVEQVQALTVDFGGFIESSSITGETNGFSGRIGDFTIRVPIASYNEMLERLENLGTLSFLNTTAVNVSDQYADITSRLTSLRTQEDRVLELIEIAEDLSDLLLLEERLGEIIFDIERLTGERNHLDNQVSYSTITILISEYEDAFSGYGLASQSLGNIFMNSLRALMRFGLMSLRILVALIPWLVLVSIVGVVWLIIRKVRPKKGKKNKGVKKGNKGIETSVDEENSE